MWICAIGFVLIVAAGIVARFAFGWEPVQFGGHMLVGGWMMPFGMIAMVCFWGFILLLVTRGFGHRPLSCCGGGHEDSKQVLKDRLAKGEITIEEYETIVKKISEDK
jgi:putative membrane protein